MVTPDDNFRIDPKLFTQEGFLQYIADKIQELDRTMGRRFDELEKAIKDKQRRLEKDVEELKQKERDREVEKEIENRNKNKVLFIIAVLGGISTLISIIALVKSF